MSNPTVSLSGSLDSGLIIKAERAPHLGGGEQVPMVLTPAQAMELYRLLDEAWQRDLHPVQNRDEVIKLCDVVQTCPSFPAQWEAKTPDGFIVYIRYRGGHLSLGMGRNLEQAIAGTFFVRTGLNHHPEMTIEDVCRIAHCEIVPSP